MLQEEPGTLRYSEGENVRNLVGGKVGDQYTLLAIIIYYCSRGIRHWLKSIYVYVLVARLYLHCIHILLSLHGHRAAIVSHVCVGIECCGLAYVSFLIDQLSPDESFERTLIIPCYRKWCSYRSSCVCSRDQHVICVVHIAYNCVQCGCRTSATIK